MLALTPAPASDLDRLRALLVGPDERVLYAILSAALLAGIGGLVLRRRARPRA